PSEQATIHKIQELDVAREYHTTLLRPFTIVLVPPSQFCVAIRTRTTSVGLFEGTRPIARHHQIARQLLSVGEIPPRRVRMRLEPLLDDQDRHEPPCIRQLHSDVGDAISLMETRSEFRTPAQGRNGWPSRFKVRLAPA